jgi:flagellar basal-body rod modification protein FlgD
MTTTVIPITTVGSTTTPTPTVHKTALDSSDYLKLLMNELKSQDPMDPMSDKDYMAQMAQLNSVQELQKMNTTLSDMTQASQMTEAASMIGRTVQASLPDGTIANGAVTSVTVKDGSVNLTVGDKEVPMSSVTSVSDGK